MGPVPYFFLDHEKTCSITMVLEPRMGPAPYFSRSWEDLFDYYGTQTPDGICSLFFSSLRRPNRLLRYSISGWDQLPIFLDQWNDNLSTTSVLYHQMGQALYLLQRFSRPWEDLFDYYGTRTPDETSSLFFSTMRRLVRLLRYSNPGCDMLPIFLVPETT